MDRQSAAKQLEFVCINCKRLLSKDKFVQDKNQKQGIRFRCKECQRSLIKHKRKNDKNFKEGLNRRMRSFRHTEHGALAQRLMSAKKRAKDSGLPFNIDLNYLKEIYKNQKGLCAISKKPMSLLHTGQCWDSVSLDRMNPKLGYVKGNIQFITKLINLIKNQLNMEELKELCKQILIEGSETISKESRPEVKPVEVPNTRTV